jgi:protein arginine kinase activator
MTTCDLCDQPAIYHDVRIVNNIHSTTHLCAEHALEAGVNLGPIDLSIILNVKNESSESSSTRSCPDCGMTILQYKKSSLLGCPTCYVTFKEELLPIIHAVQNNNSQHVGRAPSQMSVGLNRHLQIRRLLKKLESAVRQEEYEQAASLRDELRELHKSDDHHEN